MEGIVFKNRDFTEMVAAEIDIEVERYSHSMIGGPDSAVLKTPATASKWELMKLLRCPVEIYGTDGAIKWWGFVNRIVVPHGKIRVGLGLSALHNSITVKYADASTVAATNIQSTSEFGTKERLISLPSATETEATNYRDTYLKAHEYAVTEIELSGEASEVVIDCQGWWSTLSWKYYSDANTTPVENTTQISSIVSACGQFIAGTVIENVSGLTSVPTRDGSNNGLAYIVELLNAGSSNARPMLAYVDRNRFLHIYERPVETVDYLMREDGRLETILGRLVEPEDCIHAVWVKIKDVPDMLGGVNVMRPFFIERAEYVEQSESTGERFS